MDSEIPEDFLQVTKASTKSLEDSKTIIALCTTSEQLLELVGGKVIDSCDIERVADDIVTFTSYDPLQQYYLVRSQEHLIVVKRSPLCIIKTYDGVVEVNIEDRMRIGRPQVVIRIQTENEPIITDFVGQVYSSAPHVVPVLTASLSGKLQEINARVTKARRMLQEKQSARYKALYRFTPHLQPPAGSTECEPRVLVWGPPLPTQRPVAEPPLVLSRPWRKVHNGKWIIGISVFNATNTAVHDVRLRLRQISGGEAEPQLRYRSLVMGFSQRTSGGAEWFQPHTSGAQTQNLTEIARRSPAVVVGVLEEPMLKKSSAVSISGAIIYKQRGETNDIQDVIGDEVQFTVEDLIHGSLVPFSSQSTPEESDLISVIVSSLCWQLCVTPRHCMSAPITGALAQLGFIQVKELGCWVGPRGGSLAGLLVISADLKLQVYAKETKQALIFVHSLQSQWSIEVCRGSAASVRDCITNLRAELCSLHSIARPGAEYEADEWNHNWDKLNRLELATDLSFESHMAL